MKKNIFIVILLIIIIQLSAHANYDVNRPLWNEFVPYGFEDAQPDYNSYFVYGKRCKAKQNNYWYKRRQDFEREVSYCDSIPQQHRKACYEKVRARQNRINDEYKRQEAIAAEQRAASLRYIRENIEKEQQRAHELELRRQPINVQYNGTMHHDVNIYSNPFRMPYY